MIPPRNNAHPRTAAASAFLDSEGNFSLRPFCVWVQAGDDPSTLRRTYSIDTSQVPHLFSHRGTPYKFWGVWRQICTYLGAGWLCALLEQTAGPR